ncbi:DMT family transporter [Polyangium spumosum]|uniref:DMT family transporter n=1 Tax=Polyangium spumosum TaxID=889282 RepID=UPI00308466F5
MSGASGRARAAFIVALASLSFAVSSPMAMVARPAHPLFLAFGRVLLASILLFAFDPAGVVRHARAVTPAVRLRIVACGVLLGAHFALFQVGLFQTSLPAAVSLVSLEPLSVVVCAFLVHGVRPTRREQIGVLLATAGAVVIGQAAGAGDHRLSGDLFVLGAVSLYGLYVAAARAIKDALPARHAGSLIYGVAAITIFVVLPPLGALDGVTQLPARSFVALVVIAVVPTIIGHTSVQAAARTLPPAIVALVSPGETLGSIVIGALFLGLLPTGLELVGGAVILAGVLVAILGPEGRTDAPRAAEDPDARRATGT